MLKTMVMMLGEVDFSSVFAQNIGYEGIEPTAALPYPYQTLILFAVFVLVVPIVVMNLLVTLNLTTELYVLIKYIFFVLRL